MAGGLSDNDFAEVLAEHQLAVSARNGRTTVGARWGLLRFFGRSPDIFVSSDDTLTNYDARGRTIASVTNEGTRSGALPAYLHFVRTKFGGHPLLLKRIANTRRVPHVLRLAHLSPMHAGGSVTIRLTGEAPAALASPGTAYEEVSGFDGSEPIDGLFLRSPREKPPVEARLAESLRLLGSPAPLMGVLAFFEVSLERGTALPPEIAATLQTSTDAAVREFLDLVSLARGKQDLDAAVRAFGKLRGHAGERAPLLGAFEAPVQRSLKQDGEARRLLHELLLANPEVTGAWKDLGDLYLSAWDFDRAWACWQKARRLAPSFPTLNDVTAFEKRLELAHPEYFSLG